MSDRDAFVKRAEAALESAAKAVIYQGTPVSVQAQTRALVGIGYALLALASRGDTV